MSVGQTVNITISGGTMPYSILSNGGNLVQSSLNGNVLTLNGISGGTSLMNVCSAGGNCATLSINISGPTVNGGVPFNSTLPAGCSSAAGYSQTTGQRCSAVSSVVASLPVDCLGTTQYSMSTGQICTNYVAPAPTAISDTTVTPATIISTPAPAPSTSFKFTTTLKLGSSGTAVSQLQKKLKTLGFYSGKIDGGFGASTEKAVKAFQKAHKLQQVGSVGPKTRALLNK